MQASTPPGTRPRVTLSVVSHGHGSQVIDMLRTFAQSSLSQRWSVDIVVTLNIPEPSLEALLEPPLRYPGQPTWPFPVRVLKNSRPLGFGSNHNQALNIAESDWFCIVNPDILWPTIPVDLSLPCEDEALQLSVNASDTCGENGEDNAIAVRPVGLYVPSQISPQGIRQDHARKLPLPWVLACRVLSRLMGQSQASMGAVLDISRADWVNGACMVFSACAYRQLGGFDSRYFMYAEDVDICLRLQLHGYAIAPLPLEVIHHAQRNTARQWRHLGWHIRSLLRLWLSLAFWRYALTRHRLRQS